MKKKKKKSRFLASHLVYSILGFCVCVCLQELKLSSPLHLFNLQIHDYPESWVSWVRGKAISIILEKAVTPNNLDSPILGDKVSSKKGIKKKKIMPMYSPLKLMKS